MYADDTSLCYQTSEIKTFNEAINDDLTQLETWLKGNKLSLYVAKQILCFFLLSNSIESSKVVMKN